MNMKKLAAVVMALVLCLSAASAMALTLDDVDGSILSKSGSTYTLLKSGSFDQNGASIYVDTDTTLDLKNFTLTLEDHTFGILVRNGAKLTIKGNGGKLTKVVKNSELGQDQLLCVMSGSTVDIDNGATVEYDAMTVTVWKDATLNVKGTVRSKDTSAISGNGTDNDGTTIIISGDGLVESVTDTAIYHPQRGTLTIKENAVVKGNVGVEIRNGSLSVEGNAAVLTTAMNGPQASAEGNGTTVINTAIAVSPHSNTDDETVKVKIGLNATVGTEKENSMAAAIYSVKTKTVGDKAGASEKSETSVTIGGKSMIDGTIMVEDQQNEGSYETPYQTTEINGGFFTDGIDLMWTGSNPAANVGTGDSGYGYPEESVLAVGNDAISDAIEKSVKEKGASETVVQVVNGSVNVKNVPEDVKVYNMGGPGTSATINGVKVPALTEEDYKNGNIKPYIVPGAAAKQAASLPQTGDTSSLLLWSALLAAAMVGYVTMGRKVRA